MLERYIEKNIFRQVYLCQQLYQKKEITLQAMAERLNVCTPTITNDLEALKESFTQEIISFERTRNTCKLFFDPAYSLLELTQRIYRRSDFLRVLNDFLIGNTHWSEIAEKEFLSTSKIYQLRADIFDFADELGYSCSKQQLKLPEKDLRYLLLAIARYTGERSAIPFNKMIASAAEELIDYVEEHFFARDYPESEREIIILGIQLSNRWSAAFHRAAAPDATPAPDDLHHRSAPTDASTCRHPRGSPWKKAQTHLPVQGSTPEYRRSDPHDPALTGCSSHHNPVRARRGDDHRSACRQSRQGIPRQDLSLSPAHALWHRDPDNETVTPGCVRSG